MKEEKQNLNDKKELKSNRLIVIIVIIVLITVFILLITINKNNASRVENRKVEMFNTSMQKTYSDAKSLDYETAKQFIISETYDARELYGGVDGVDYSANYILGVTNTDTSGNVEDLISRLTEETNDVIDDVLNGNVFSQEESNIIRNSLTIRSNTVCSDSDIEEKYCVNNLNARTYVVDENSDKWAVIIHPFMTSGSIMYTAIGEMYNNQGFNVLAPNLRGFGGSSGSVAMGYLESLDIYDWIKDLNTNYNRYGVKKSPETIVVHGMSLGGATTLQLATNPDIAGAIGDPYTSNLTQLHVKGFVDDCGYTSMTGIITSMLTMGDMTQITSLLGSMGIDQGEFMKEFSKLTEKLNIQGFEEFKFTNSEIKSFDTIEKLNNMKKFVGKYNELENKFSQIENGNTSVTIPGLDQSKLQELINKYANNEWKNLIPNIPQQRNDYTTEEQDNTNIQHKYTNESSVTNGLISQVLREIIGVGLTETNYEKYSDSFSSGRHFPTNSKIMIIHGTGDTMVPHSNSNIVANNSSPAVLLHKWDVPGAPHAFVLMGTNKEQYAKLVKDFTNCVLDSNCTSIN